jgi:hypothetical protein
MPLTTKIMAPAAGLAPTNAEADVGLIGASGRWEPTLAAPATCGQPGHVAVVIQTTPPTAIAPLISAVYGFTARERALVGRVDGSPGP